ncbi:MAG: glycosyltransferase family 4 protein [Anaerolineae bacterium]|nr:glycosyltransferase family 4 protein [Anaerolineae bacterium]
MKVTMIGPFGLRPRMTMSARALPLAKALVARGHTVTMLLPPWQNPEDAGRAWDEGSVRIENMPLPAGVPGWFHWRLAASLARRTRALQPDVIHIFKPKAYAGLAHLALGGRFPVVVDTDDWEGPGGWNDRSPYPAPLKAFFTWQERWGLAHARAVTVASRALQTLVWATGRPPESVFYIPNGVAGGPPESVFYIPNGVAGGPPEAQTPEPARPTLLLYTRFFEFKVTRLWRVVCAVRDVRPDVRLLVVGKGLFGEEAQLLELARTQGYRLADNAADTAADLVYPGWVPAEALPALFAQATLALYPFDDTLLNRTKCPVKLMDLLAAGVPVVADAVGQIAEAIRPGETGILVPPGDEAANVAAILALLDDQQRRARGQRAARDVHARFAWDNLVNIAEEAYDYAKR